METPQLLMISGWGFPPGCWRQTVRFLGSACECRVFDAGRLLGRDQVGDLGPRIASTLRDQVDPRRIAYLGGWSIGGMLALQCAPFLADTVRGLLLISATPQFCRSDGQPWGASPAEVRAMRHGLRRQPDAILKAFYRQVAAPFDSEDPDPGSVLAEALENLDGLRYGLDYLLRADLHGPFRNAGLPVVLVHGREDAVVPDSGSVALSAQLQPSRLDRIARAGHDLPLRRPDIVGEAVRCLERLCL